MMKSAHPKKGFTIVELLVVISIIALLVSLLLPSLTAARAVANATTCMSNMRQQGITVASYTNSNKQGLPFEALYYENYNPPNGVGSNGSGGPVVSTGAAQQLVNTGDLDPGPTRSFLPPGGPWAPNIYCPGILTCPGEPSIGIAGYLSTNNGQVSAAATFRNGYTRNVLIAGAADVREAASANYGYPGGYVIPIKTNYAFSGFNIGGLNFNYPGLQLPMRNWLPYGSTTSSTPPLYNVELPSQPKVDQAIGGQGLWIAYDGVFSIATIVYRHPNRTGNYLYLDGHVEAKKPGDVDALLSQAGGDPFNSWDARMSLGGNSR